MASLTDVADWADNYAGFVYEKGITKGISEEEFGMSMTATAQQFVICPRSLI